MRRTRLHHSAGVVRASPERVRTLLLDVRPGPTGPDNCWLLDQPGTVTGGPQRFTVRLTGSAMTVEVDADTIAFQGGWWYRGEYTVAAHDEGALLAHEVYDVAERARWGVALANRFFVGFEERTRAGFADQLGRVGDALGCETRLLPG